MSIDNTPEWLHKSIILQGITGSTAHGTSIEGSEDRDELGVCIEPISESINLGLGFEQRIIRTAAERWVHQSTCPQYGCGPIHSGGNPQGVITNPGEPCNCTPYKKHDARSQPGDLDLTIFSLRKFARLAAAGNPSVLLLLFTPDLTKLDGTGSQLRDLKDAFISKEAGHRFLGYMHGQKQRLLGEKGQKRVKRPDLEEKFGFDTKYAYHILRLGLQGIELMRTGKLQLPMSEKDREFLLDVRTGKYTFNQVLTSAGEFEVQLKEEIELSHLQTEADRPVIEDFIQRVYLDRWKALSYSRS